MCIIPKLGKLFQRLERREWFSADSLYNRTLRNDSSQSLISPNLTISQFPAMFGSAKVFV